MLQFNKKLKIMCAAAALTLTLLPVSCGGNDGNNDTNNNNTTNNGVNSNGIYDGADDGNENILGNAGSAIEDGMNALGSDISGIDDGMTNNSTSSTDNSRMGTTSASTSR